MVLCIVLVNICLCLCNCLEKFEVSKLVGIVIMFIFINVMVLLNKWFRGVIGMILL